MDARHLLQRIPGGQKKTVRGEKVSPTNIPKWKCLLQHKVRRIDHRGLDLDRIIQCAVIVNESTNGLVEMYLSSVSYV